MITTVTSKRPTKFDECVIALAKNDIIKVLSECPFAEGYDLESVWIEISKAIARSWDEDGYQLAKRLEDDHFIFEMCLQDAEQLDGTFSILSKYCDISVKEWVKTNNVVIPYILGDWVEFKNGCKMLQGEITKIDTDKAIVLVCCHSEGHHIGRGCSGIFVPVEKVLRKVDKPA